MGFGDFRFSTALMLLGLYVWISRYYVLCAWLAISQMAWYLQLLPSDNLWDYLIDPWIALFAPWGWWYTRGNNEPPLEPVSEQS